MAWSSTSLCVTLGLLLALQLRHEVHTSFRVVTSNALLVLKLNAISYFEERTLLDEKVHLEEDAFLEEHLSAVERAHAASNRQDAHYYQEQQIFDVQQLNAQEKELQALESWRLQLLDNFTEVTKEVHQQQQQQQQETYQSNLVCHYLTGVCDFFRGDESSKTLSQERLQMVQLSSQLNGTSKVEYLENVTTSMLIHEMDAYKDTAAELLELAHIWQQASQWDHERAHMDEQSAQELGRLIASERRLTKVLCASLWIVIELELHSAIQKLWLSIVLALMGLLYYSRRLVVGVSEWHPEQRAAVWQDFLLYSVISINAMAGLSLLSHDLFLNVVVATDSVSQRIAGWAWMSLFGALLLAVVRPADTVRMRVVHFGLGCCLFPIFNGMVVLILSLFPENGVIALFSHPLTTILGLLVLVAQSYAFREYYDGSTLPTTTRDDETLVSELSPLRSDTTWEVSTSVPSEPSEPYSFSGKSTTRISFRSIATTTQCSQLVYYVWLLLAMICGKLLLEESRHSFTFHPYYTVLLYVATIAGCVWYVHFGCSHPCGDGAPVRSVRV